MSMGYRNLYAFEAADMVQVKRLSILGLTRQLDMG